MSELITAYYSPSSKTISCTSCREGTFWHKIINISLYDICTTTKHLFEYVKHKFCCCREELLKVHFAIPANDVHTWHEINFFCILFVFVLSLISIIKMFYGFGSVESILNKMEGRYNAMSNYIFTYLHISHSSLFDSSVIYQNFLTQSYMTISIKAPFSL